MNNKPKLRWSAFLSAFFLASSAFAQLNENFNDISTLGGSGWTIVNNSSPAGGTSYFQGNPGVFGAQSGAPNAYIAANFNNATIGGNISTWLILPTLSLNPSSVLTFFTQSAAGSPFPDRLEVRLSTNGSSADVGMSATSVGDFSTLLLSINPTLMAGGYPSSWMQFSVPLSSVLTMATNGRLAFRYFVTDTNNNGDYIGIDTVSVTSAVPDEASTFALTLIACTGVLLASRLRKALQPGGTNHV